MCRSRERRKGRLPGLYLSIDLSTYRPIDLSIYLSIYRIFFQGDSGGPLVCPEGSGGGHWVALGVTSWGKGCGRSWGNNSSRHPSRRGSPGVFTDVRLLLPWIKRKLREGMFSTSLSLDGSDWFERYGKMMRVVICAGHPIAQPHFISAKTVLNVPDVLSFTFFYAEILRWKRFRGGGLPSKTLESKF